MVPVSGGRAYVTAEPSQLAVLHPPSEEEVDGAASGTKASQRIVHTLRSASARGAASWRPFVRYDLGAGQSTRLMRSMTR
jgi:hypothetical protein